MHLLVKFLFELFSLTNGPQTHFGKMHIFMLILFQLRLGLEEAGEIVLCRMRPRWGQNILFSSEATLITNVCPYVHL